MCVVAEGGRTAGAVPTHTPSSHPCGINILTETGRRWGVASLTGFLLVLGRAQDDPAMPKQDPKKPQALLESVTPPPHLTPPDSGGKH